MSESSARARDANIFVVHSRFQLVIVQQMLSTMAELRSRDNHLVLDMRAAGLPIDPANWTRVHALDPPVGGSIRGRGAACRAALARVSAIGVPYDAVTLLMSDIQWPLNNALYGRLVCPRGSRIRLHNFPDGIANLQIVFPDWRQRARDLVKALIGMFGGVPYRPFSSDIAGLVVSERIYSLLPDAVPALREKTVRIPVVAAGDQPADAEACLFVGQNYDQLMPHDAFAAIAEAAAVYARSLGYRRMMYKPHPLESATIGASIFRRHGFEILNEQRTVEEMFLARRLGCAVSYNSSALVHLKLMFGAAVRCVSVFSSATIRHTLVDDDAPAKMLAVFALCGVEVHE